MMDCNNHERNACTQGSKMQGTPCANSSCGNPSRPAKGSACHPIRPEVPIQPLRPGWGEMRDGRMGQHGAERPMSGGMNSGMSGGMNGGMSGGMSGNRQSSCCAASPMPPQAAGRTGAQTASHTSCKMASEPVIPMGPQMSSQMGAQRTSQMGAQMPPQMPPQMASQTASQTVRGMAGWDALAGLPLAMGYVPMQQWGQTYELSQGFQRGTIFPDLDLPFIMGRCR